MRILTPYWPQQRATADFFDQMEQLLAAPTERAFKPAAEAIEHKDHYFMSFDLPGMKKENIRIEIKDNVLIVAGERKQETRDEGEQKAQVFERQYGSFYRSFTLPTAVNEEKIVAQYEDGVLSLTLPKIPIAQPKKIQIQ